MKLIDLINDNEYNYYAHKSSDYGNMTPEEKANSYFTNGIINIKNTELNRSAIKIETKKESGAFKYYVNPDSSEEEQFASFYSKPFGGLEKRDYTVIIRSKKGDGDKIIVPNSQGEDGKYKISSENIVAVIYRKENPYTARYEYKLFISPFIKAEQKETFFHTAGNLPISDKTSKFKNENQGVPKYFFVPDNLTSSSDNSYKYKKGKTTEELLEEVVTNSKIGYQKNMATYACGEKIVTRSELEDMINRGCNIIRGKVLNHNLIVIEFEEYRLVSKKTL